ncbi:MAG TPA: hypothetical protein VGN11_07980 [Candidatus Baltobacteraceae bacterium]|nr:hypothetical protein [Candidatus Baltobacteraceae bacterium]
MKCNERGDSLIEAVVAVALIGIALAAAFSASIAAAHRFGADAGREALQKYVGREMRLAVDVLKYQGGAITPRTIATTVPLAGASPLAAHVSIAVSPLPGSGFTITLSATSDDDATKSATLQAIVAQPAPLPSSTVESGLRAPAPIGGQ